MRRAVLVVSLGLSAVALAAAGPVGPAPVAPPTSGEDVAAIQKIAGQSQCATRQWKARGRAPRTYVEGVALVYARAACHPERAEVQAVSAPANMSATNDDGLAAYQAEFKALGLRNDVAGPETLRHTYALLIGLGMMESSGQYCEGRDVSQCFTTAESAEAGLFQTSYGARRFAKPVLDDLFVRYSADQSACRLTEFKGAIACKIRTSHNPSCPTATSDVAGTGPGADWQGLSKTCPAFATEYAAVLLRKHGGQKKGEFGPIRKKQVELRPECDGMLREVETFVKQHPQVCQAL